MHPRQRGSSAPRAIGVAAVFAAALLGPVAGTPFGPVALAQPIALPAGPGVAEYDSTDEGLTFFVSLDAGRTPYTATYEGSSLQQDLAEVGLIQATGSFTFEERDQELQNIGGMAGVRMALPARLHLSVGLGVSALELREQNLSTDPLYADDHDEFRSLEPNPGFSAMLGLDWEAMRLSHVSFAVGFQVIFMSSFGLRGNSVDGANLTLGGAADGTRLTFSTVDTTDLSMQFITFQPHLGFEWRPVGSVFVNSFGAFSTLVASSASMTKRFRSAREDFAADGSVTQSNFTATTIEMDMTIQPIQVMGGYYGWYVALPRFGTIGAEVQFGSRWNLEASYQYSF